MGSWGTQPKYNDGACDLWYDIEDTVQDERLAALNRMFEPSFFALASYVHETQLRWERCGVLQIFVERLLEPNSRTVSGENLYKEQNAAAILADPLLPLIFWKAHADLTICLADDVWVRTWNNEKEFHESTKRFRDWLGEWIIKLT